MHKSLCILTGIILSSVKFNLSDFLNFISIVSALHSQEIKRKLNSENTCYHSIQYCVPLRYSKKINIKMNITFLLVNSHGCETWFRTLQEEQRLRAFKNRVLQKRSGPMKSWG